MNQELQPTGGAPSLKAAELVDFEKAQVEHRHGRRPASISAPSQPARRWPLVVLATLAAIAPFNVKPTTQAWTDLQLRPLVIVSVVAVVGLVAQALRAQRFRPDWIDVIAYLWLAAIWLSALLSDSVVVGAGGAIRLSVAILLIPATRALVKQEHDEWLVLRNLAVGAAAGAVLGLGIWLFRSGADGTQVFVGQVTRVGPFDRLTRPWSHANVAAMALGMSIASASVVSGRRTRYVQLVTMTVALVLTVSRGGMFAGVAAALVWLICRRRRTDTTVVASLAVIAAVVFALSSAWDARVDEPSDRAFYANEIQAPSSLLVDQSDQLIDITVTNLSSRTWQRDGEDRVLISARWVGPDGLVWTEDRWSLPTDLAPGDELTAPLTIAARLPSGNYQVQWDVMVDQVAYFGQFLGDPPVVSRGTVSSDIAMTEVEPYDLVERTVDVGRLRAWRLALEDLASSPLVGVGPNQFGDRASVELARSGQTVGAHAHNIVLEPLAAWGMLGSLPFFVLGTLALQRALLRAWRTRSRQAVAIAAGLVATVVHGTVDWPLVVITTGIPLGLLAGLALADADTS